MWQRVLSHPRYPLESSSLEHHSGPRRPRLRWIGLIGIRLGVMEPSPHWRRHPSRMTNTKRNTRSMYTNHLRHTSQTHTFLTYANNRTIPLLQLSDWQRIWRTSHRKEVSTESSFSTTHSLFENLMDIHAT